MAHGPQKQLNYSSPESRIATEQVFTLETGRMPASLSLWAKPPATNNLAGDQVHLWRFRLDLPAAGLDRLKQLLCSDELLRADRLLDPLKSNHFIVARGRLRQILSRYLDLPPRDLGFAYSRHGKPYLADNYDKELAFNLAHAGSWGLLAVTSGVEVGVDLEQVDQTLEYEKMAPRFFSPAEIDCLEQYSSRRRRRGFFRIWTRKEARLKGAGSGFSTPASCSQDTDWLLRSFTVDRNYLGAVAVAGQVKLVQRWDFV